MKKNACTYNPIFQTTNLLPVYANGSMIEITVNPTFDQGFSQEDNEIVCYRRNYFSVTTSVTFHTDFSSPVYTADMNGQRIQIRKFKLEIEASSEREPILISFFNTARKKLDDDLNMTQSDVKMHRPGETTDVRFERMQFKSSTPSGSKGSKKYVEFAVKLIAVMENGTQELLAISISEQFLIRGMSPSYYQKNTSESRVKASRKKDTKPSNYDYAVFDRIAVALSMESDVPDLMKSPETLFGSPNSLHNSPTLYPGLASPYANLGFEYPTYSFPVSAPEAWTSPTSSYSPMSDFDLLFEQQKNESLQLPYLLL
ncbi:hypothetical protein HDV06_005077 [Boothiomyces sp. JEL0866]|nr:hypothetical protein HDV06_005077 [Boothiomyces sp. JEL0866]